MITFLIPTFNTERHMYNGEYIFERCLKSIRSQRGADIKIIVIDAFSTDNTREIAKKYNCQILFNPLTYAEFGLQIGMKYVDTEYVVIFSSDNELEGYTWAEFVLFIFGHLSVDAVWGKIESGKHDPLINKYHELIQNDPLTWFINHNINYYLGDNQTNSFGAFNVIPEKPLVWGANGLVYRTKSIQDIWQQEGYLGDNDAFQTMVEKGRNKVVYVPLPFVQHHHVQSLADWCRKWSRNLKHHTLGRSSTRNMRWVTSGSFKVRLLWWFLYLAIAFPHSLILALKTRQKAWLYHAPCCIAQTFIYSTEVIKWKLNGISNFLLDMLNKKHMQNNMS